MEDAPAAVHKQGDDGDNMDVEEVGSDLSGGDELPALDQTNTTSAFSVTNIAMDSSSTSKGDNYNHVAFQMRLNSKKKVMTILPEEALALIIAQSKKKVKVT